MSENEIVQKIVAPVVDDNGSDEFVVIPKDRYDSLLKDEAWRSAVENAGVDNWGGFGYAMDLLHGDEED